MAEIQIPATIEPKTPDRLQADLGVINLERHMRQEEPLSQNLLDPQHEQHNVYVDSLRQLRRDQTAFLQNRGDKAEVLGGGNKDSSKREVGQFFNERTFSPLGWAAIKAIEAPHGNYGTLTAAQQKEAVQSVDGIVRAVDSYVHRQKFNALSKLDEIGAIIGPEKTAITAERILQKDPVGILNSAAIHEETTNQERLTGFVRKAADAALDNPDRLKELFNTGLLLQPELRAIFTPDEQKLLAETFLGKTHSYVPANLNSFLSKSSAGCQIAAEEFVSLGLVSESQMLDCLTALVKEDTYLDSMFVESLDVYVEKLEQAGKLEEVKQAVIDKVEDNKLAISCLVRVKYIGEGQKQQAVRSFLEKHTIEALVMHSGSVLQYVDKDTVEEVFARKWIDMDPGEIIGSLVSLPDTVMDLAQKRQYMRGAYAQAPEMVWHDTNLVLTSFEPAEAGDMIRQALTSLPDNLMGSCFRNIDEWMPLVAQDSQQQKQIVDTLTDLSHGLGLLDYYHGSDILKACVPLDELRGIIGTMIITDSSGYFNIGIDRHIDSLVGLFDQDTVKAWTSQACRDNPEVGVVLLMSTEDFYDADSYKQMVIQFSYDKPLTALGSIDLMKASYLSYEDKTELVDRCVSSNAYEAAVAISYLQSHRVLSPMQLNDYFAKVELVNPPLAYFLGVEVGEDEHAAMATFERMKSDGATRQLAPKWFDEFFAEFEKSSETSREIVMKQAMNLYLNFEELRHLEPDMLIIPAQLSQNPKQQYGMFSKLSFTAKHGDAETVAACLEVTTVDQLDAFTFQALSKGLDVSPESLNVDRVESMLVPFVTYAKSFIDSPKHKVILAEIARQPDGAAFRDFRLIADDPTQRDQAKEIGLLPKQLTARQHQLWRQDDSLSSYEDLRSSADDVAFKIRDTLLGALHDFGFQANEIRLDADQFSTLQHDITRLGSRVAELHKLRATTQGPVPTETNELLVETTQALRERQLLAALHTMVNLPAGQILDGGKLDANGNVAQPLQAVFNRMAKLTKQLALTGDAGLSIAQAVDTLTYFHEQTSEVRQLTVEDTIDPKITLEIGSKPVGTCQDYATGQYKECLLGYTEPNTKIIAVRDGDTVVARSIFRLLETNQGSPALHVETIYTQSASPIITQKVYELATKKAQTMKLPVFVSHRSQGADGGKVDMPEVAGYKLEHGHDQLSARGMRAPYVYVDSSSGSRSGAYKIGGLLQLIATAPTD